MNNINLTEWLKSGDYLPSVMRDFHDQKHIFRAIHGSIDLQKHYYCKDIKWISGHCYVIDIFLWWMAKHGYTLQRTRVRADFRDLGADVKEAIDAQNAEMAKAMGLTPHKREVNRE